MLAALLCLPALGGRAEAGQSAQERQAQPRSSGSSGSSSRHSGSSASSDRHSGSSQSSAAQRHAQPRSQGASRSAGSSSGRHVAPGVRPDAPPVLSGAQARHPRAGTGTGYRYGGGYYGGGYYGGYHPYYPGYRYPWYAHSYYPYGRYPWYGPGFGLGLGLGFGSAYYGYYPYYGGAAYSYYPAPAPVAYVAYSDPDAGSVRVQVQPRKTRVYVDGNLAGVADDFDGMLQGLTLAPGRHELTLELDGYRTHRVQIYVSPGVQLKIRHDMEKGAGGPSLEDLTEGREDEEPVAEAPERDDRYARSAPAEARSAGVLRLRVSPADASIYVDGAFVGNALSAAELTLTPGAHRVEVVRPGYDPWVREIDVEASERRELVVELPAR